MKSQSEIDNVDVIVLCGGLGTRLSSVVPNRPKPMALVNGKPFLEYVVSQIASYGFNRFIFCSGYKAQMIREHFSRFQNQEILFSEEKVPLGTGGAIKLCESQLKGDRVLIVNGDSMCPLNVRDLFAVHRTRGAMATMALTLAGDRADVGFVELAEDGRIVSLKEKRRGDGTKHVNAGVYVFEKSVFDLIPDGKCSLEKEIFPKLTGKGFYGYDAKCDLYDIGTPERFEYIQSRTDIFDPQTVSL